jgi:S1-C subfamily serine protease
MYRQVLAGLALLGLGLVASSPLAQSPAATKRQPRAFLGVAVEPARDGGHPGVVVRDVTPDSPAAKAELKSGDVIVKVGDRDVKDPDDLIAAVAQHKPGDKLTFHVMRQGQASDVPVTLGERPAARAGDEDQARERTGSFLGVLTRPLTPADKERHGLTAEQGAVVIEVLPGSPAEHAGLRRGDVITAANGKPVSDPVELRRTIERVGPGKDLALSLVRGQEKKEVRARLEESPVDGIAAPLGRAVTSRFLDTGKVSELERRVTELERRVRELEQKRNPEK